MELIYLNLALKELILTILNLKALPNALYVMPENIVTKEE